MRKLRMQARLKESEKTGLRLGAKSKAKPPPTAAEEPDTTDYEGEELDKLWKEAYTCDFSTYSSSSTPPPLTMPTAS